MCQKPQQTSSEDLCMKIDMGWSQHTNALHCVAARDSFAKGSKPLQSCTCSVPNTNDITACASHMLPTLLKALSPATSGEECHDRFHFKGYTKKPQTYTVNIYHCHSNDAHQSCPIPPFRACPHLALTTRWKIYDSSCSKCV